MSTQCIEDYIIGYWGKLHIRNTILTNPFQEFPGF